MDQTDPLNLQDQRYENDQRAIAYFNELPAPQPTPYSTVGSAIVWPTTAGIGPPQFNTSSPGSRLVLYPFAGPSSADYAIGIEAGNIWQSVPAANNSYGFKWYGGTTYLAGLSGAGNWYMSTPSTGGTLGIGVQPSFNLYPGTNTLEIGYQGTGLMSGPGAAGTLTLTSNIYLDSGNTWRYAATGYGVAINLGNTASGNGQLYVTASGTAGSAVSFVGPVLGWNNQGNLTVGQPLSGNPLTATGMIVSSISSPPVGQFAAVNGTGSTWYSVIQRNDGSSWYLLASAAQTTQGAAETASWSALRPFAFNMSNGVAQIGPAAAGNTALVVTNSASASNALLVNNAGAGDGLIRMDGASGTTRGIMGSTGGVARWQMRLGQANAETGSNVGSDFGIDRYADNGNYLGTPVTIFRASGQIALQAPSSNLSTLIVNQWSGGNFQYGLAVNGTDANGTQIAISNQSGSGQAGINLSANNGGVYGYCTISSSGLGLVNQANFPLFLGTNNTTRLFIASSGAIGVGSGVALYADYSLYASQFTWEQPSGATYYWNFCDATFNNGANQALHIRGLTSSGAAESAISQFYVNATTSVLSGSLNVGGGAVGTTGEIRATNNITAYYSDERLKTDIREIDGAVGKVMRLRGVYFRANEVAAKYGYETQSQQVGVIAQDVERELPEAVRFAPFDRESVDGVEVSKSGENYLTVQYDKLVPLLIEAIKDQQRQIEEIRRVL